MENFLIYIGKAALAAGTFYLLYLALFQHQKQFVFNRIYLPVSLALSFLIPQITFTRVKYIQPVQVLNTDSFAYLPEATEIAQPEFVYQWFHYGFAIYLVGILGFALHLLFGHLKAISIIRFSRLKELFNATVNVTSKDVHPFSFFNKIVLSEKTLDNPNLEVIVSHEKIHVDEKHTLDILFAEILFLLQWFNPFAWLIKDAIRNNLEFKTDDQITKNNNAEAYQLAMVGLAHKKGVAPFLTALNGSQLKNRIIMMKKKTKNKYALLKQLVVLPLLAVLVMGLSNKEVKTEIVQAEKHFTIVVDGKVVPTNQPALAQFNFDRNFDSGKICEALEIIPLSTLFQLEAENPTLYIKTTSYIPGTNPEFDRKISEEIKEQKALENEKTLLAVDGKILSDEEAKKIDNFSIESATVLSNEHATEKYGEVAEHATVMDLKTGNPKVKIYSNTSIKEIKVKGKVTNEKGEPISAAAVLVKGTTIGTISDMSGDYIIETDENNTLIFAMTGYEKTEVEIKGKTTIDVKLVQTAEGAFMNGEPMGAIMSRSQKKAGDELVKINLSTDDAHAPLFVVDGKECESIGKVNNDDIESMSVLKGKNATILYGDKGKNGVILITTKKAAQVKLGKALVIVDGKVHDGDMSDFDENSIESVDVLKNESATRLFGEKAKDGAIIITTKNKISLDGKSPLLIVDGEKLDGNINDIDPNDIQSITVLKDEQAMTIYGEKAKDGVIIINTKNYQLNTMIDVRNFIAKNIKYPRKARDNNKEGIAQLFVKVNSDGDIAGIVEKSTGNETFLDEVVVVAYKAKPEEVFVANKFEDLSKAFSKEAERVVNMMPRINIDKFKGQTVAVTVKFVLQ